LFVSRRSVLPVLRAAAIVFWFTVYALFLTWVLFILPPPRGRGGSDDQADDKHDQDLPLAA
jgi:hypothetical protein